MVAPPIELDWSYPDSWAALSGLWRFDGAAATFLGPQNTEAAFGLATTNLEFPGGVFLADVTLQKPEVAGRLVFGHDPATGAYYSAGVGGGAAAYMVDEFVPGRGWIPVAATGAAANLDGGHTYDVGVYLYGQLMWLEVDDVEVLRVQLPHPLPGPRIGAIAWSSGTVAFANARILRQLPEAFVIMQFGQPFDDLYSDVIVPACTSLGFEARRGDDIYSPGVILQDIVTGLVRATVVVAEITPVNANVFYELGYAHALGKPTILLAQRGATLPFDVSGYRCIFYDNTIGGKDVVQDNLRRHLINIRSYG